MNIKAALKWEKQWSEIRDLLTFIPRKILEPKKENNQLAKFLRYTRHSIKGTMRTTMSAKPNFLL